MVLLKPQNLHRIAGISVLDFDPSFRREPGFIFEGEDDEDLPSTAS